MVSLQDSISGLTRSIKELIFGEGNAKLEYFMDRFYSLPPEKKAGIILSMILVPIAVFLIIIMFYFYGLFSLQKNLDFSYSSSNTIKNLKLSYTSTQSQYEQLVNNLKLINKNLNLVALLTNKAKDMGVQASDFPAKVPVIDLPDKSPLADQFQKTSVEFKLQRISLKKALEYINSVQQMPNKFRVTKFEIQQLFDTKLYFDVSIVVEALVPTQKQHNLE